MRLLAALLIVLLAATPALALEGDKLLHLGGAFWITSAVYELSADHDPWMAGGVALLCGAVKESSDGYWDGADFAANVAGALLALGLNRIFRTEW